MNDADLLEYARWIMTTQKVSWAAFEFLDNVMEYGLDQEGGDRRPRLRELITFYPRP
jgi:hypothetical protein